MTCTRLSLAGFVLLWCSSVGFGQKPLYTEAAGSAEAFKAPIGRAALNVKTGLLAVASTEKAVKLFDATALRERNTLAGITARVNALTFSPSGQSLFTCTPDGQVAVWNASTAAQTKSYEVHTGGIMGIAVQDENLVFTAGVDRTLHVFDAATGNSIGTLNATDEDYSVILLHPTNRTFAVGMTSGKVYVYSIAQLAVIKTIADMKTRISALAYSPDGKYLAVSTVDGAVGIYETQGYALLKNAIPHRLSISGIAFDPKSRWLATTSADSTVRILDVASGTEVASWSLQDQYGTWLGFTDEKSLLVATSKGLLKRWTVLPEPPDTTPPGITLEYPVTGTDGTPVKVFATQCEVRGLAYDNSDVKEVRINGLPVPLTPAPATAAVPPGTKGKQFKFSIKLDSTGVNPVSITAVDPYGLSTTATSAVRRLADDQAVELTFPSANAETPNTSSPIRFRCWFDIASYSMSANMTEIVSGQSPFLKNIGDEITEEVPLVVGYNQVRLRVISTTGQEFTKTIGITRSTSVTSTPMAAGPTTKRDKSTGPQAWAVVVGVSQYANPGIPALKFADRDAEAFANFLRRPEGGGYDTDHLRLLLNKDATLPNLRDALINFLNQAIDIDLVVIYFAGHGAPEPARPSLLYLLTYDSDPNMLGTTAFPMWQIQDVLARYISAKRIVVFSDACHSGGISVNYATRGLGVTEQNLINQYLTDLSKTKEGTVVFTASAAGEVSQEFPELGHGAFTYYLLEGMQGKAYYNNDYTVTINELMQYVEEQVKRKTRGAQNPTRSQTEYDKEMTISTIPH